MYIAPIREIKGMEIAQKCILTKNEKGWIVPSQSGGGNYIVSQRDQEPVCTCSDYKFRKCKCKHIFAVEFTLTQEIDKFGNKMVTETIKVSYNQNWKAYNNAQCNEQSFFMRLLFDLCNNVEQPEYKFGRPSLLLSNTVFASVLKVYSTFSLRRFMGFMDTALKKGYIRKPCSYVSISNVMRKEEITPVLRKLIQESSRTLKEVETHFAVDASGFSMSRFDRWFSYKYKKELKSRKWLKLHLICGTKTNIVTDAIITNSNKHDSPFLPELVNNTSKMFNIQEVSADKGYSGRKNMNAIDEAGALAFIPYKNIVKEKTQPKGSPMWKKMHHYFMFHKEEFLQHYGRRQNVETAFHMIKTKFGDSLKSKDKTAQINEIFCKVIAHNICVIVQEMFEMGVALNMENIK